MLGLALLFLLIAILASALGLTNVAIISADMAWIVAVVFLVLFFIAMLGNAVRGRPSDVL